MEETTTGPGGFQRPTQAVLAVLERVGAKYGYSYVSYPNPDGRGPWWGLSGPNLGNFENADIADRIRSDLEADPVFAAWYKP